MVTDTLSIPIPGIDTSTDTFCLRLAYYPGMDFNLLTYVLDNIKAYTLVRYLDYSLGFTYLATYPVHSVKVKHPEDSIAV